MTTSCKFYEPKRIPPNQSQLLRVGGRANIAKGGRAAGPYQKGSQKVTMPAYHRYEGDFAELAAAVRGEQVLSVSLDEELVVAETVLRVSDMF